MEVRTKARHSSVRFADYQQATALPRGGSSILTALDSKTVLRETLERPIDLGDRAGRLTVRREAYCLYPTLVWRPCRESLSPFVPFHMVTVGDHRIYVRLDGRIFAGLRLYNPGI